MIHDLAIRLNQRLGIEWRLSKQHFVHAHAQRPPITLSAVLALTVLHGAKDLRRDVVGRANGDRGLDLQDTWLNTDFSIGVSFVIQSSMPKATEEWT